MGSEYQGWVGEGRELFRGEEKSETEEAESRESYNVRNISAGGKFHDHDHFQRYHCHRKVASSQTKAVLHLGLLPFHTFADFHICWIPDFDFWNPFLDSHLPTSL